MLRRLGAALVTLWGASLLVFALLDLLPGNAAAVLLGTAARPDTLAAMSRALGTDRPAPERYLHWVAGFVTGDLGTSSTYGVPVGALLGERLSVTAPLATLAMGLALGAGCALGVLRGGWRGRAADRIGAAFGHAGIAVPDFWVGLLLILLFSTELHWFAAGGFPGWRADPAGSLKALLLPALALASPQAAVLSRVTRAALLDVGDADFIRAARARGLSGARVLWRHQFRNALGPVLTVAGLQFAFLVAGAVLVENVFGLPGIGRLATQALAQRDLPVIRTVVMVFVAVVVGANMAVDIIALALDPRLRARS